MGKVCTDSIVLETPCEGRSFVAIMWFGRDLVTILAAKKVDYDFSKLIGEELLREELHDGDKSYFFTGGKYFTVANYTDTSGSDNPCTDLYVQMTLSFYSFLEGAKEECLKLE